MDFEVIQENIEHVMSQQMPHKDKVCYDVVGCFDQKGLLAHIRLLPKPPTELATRFRLHSRSGSDLLDIYAAGGMTLSRAYRPGAPLKILAHGLGGNGNLTYLNQMKDAFLRMEDGNVVVVDWARGASLRDYAQACANAELVGREVAFLVSSLTHNGLVLPWNVHLIGFSLGAQLLGFAARRLARTYGLKAGRLTGIGYHMSISVVSRRYFFLLRSDQILYGFGSFLKTPYSGLSFSTDGKEDVQYSTRRSRRLTSKTAASNRTARMGGKSLNQTLVPTLFPFKELPKQRRPPRKRCVHVPVLISDDAALQDSPEMEDTLPLTTQEFPPVDTSSYTVSVE
ncbi:hypothetical protein HPB49_005148 [Dermacentor silvarum]|uniref:Uncharacterized protein n=1 Tax=Dermacentor silvarum TaxID=543639 RepID=A0ACB8DV83_DERSI|nr:hypothetical protein HPB49_005148 [Dermacentor silvarum]